MIKNKKRKETLSPRQIEIITFISKGYTDLETAEKLNLSKSTIFEGVKLALRNTNTVNRTHLVAWALRNGVIE